MGRKNFACVAGLPNSWAHAPVGGQQIHGTHACSHQTLRGPAGKSSLAAETKVLENRRQEAKKRNL